MILTFIRHAQSIGNVNPNIYYEIEDSKVPLSEKGIDDAKLLDLSGHVFDKLYYSPYLRCIQTKDILFGENVGTVDELLVERRWGELRDIVDSGEFDKKTHFDFYFRPKGGESFYDLYQRILKFFSYLLSEHKKGDSVCIVSHGEWIMTALQYLRRKGFDNYHESCSCVKNLEVITEKLGE
jgi:broad specificity phosphatase PhoE